MKCICRHLQIIWFITNLFYSHSYLEDNKLSEWTIYFTSNDMEFGKYLRTNDFRSDGILDYDYSARLSDYRGSGYDRGHLVPAADMNFDSIALRVRLFNE